MESELWVTSCESISRSYPVVPVCVDEEERELKWAIALGSPKWVSVRVEQRNHKLKRENMKLTKAVLCLRLRKPAGAHCTRAVCQIRSDQDALLDVMPHSWIPGSKRQGWQWAKAQELHGDRDNRLNSKQQQSRRHRSRSGPTVRVASQASSMTARWPSPAHPKRSSSPSARAPDASAEITWESGASVFPPASVRVRQSAQEHRPRRGLGSSQRQAAISTNSTPLAILSFAPTADWDSICPDSVRYTTGNFDGSQQVSRKLFYLQTFADSNVGILYTGTANNFSQVWQSYCYPFCFLDIMPNTSVKHC